MPYLRRSLDVRVNWQQRQIDRYMAKTVKQQTTAVRCFSLYLLVMFHRSALLDFNRYQCLQKILFHWPTSTMHTHTHAFNYPFSGTTRVSQHQNGQTNLDFAEASDSEWQWHQLGHCTSAPWSRQITMPAPQHSVFYRPDALPAAQPTASKHWRQSTMQIHIL